MEKSISSGRKQQIAGEMSAAEQEAYFNELAELTKVGSIPTMIVDSNLVYTQNVGGSIPSAPIIYSLLYIYLSNL